MPVYSHSQLKTHEDCPRKFRLRYIERIKREKQGVEAFMGTMVHDTLQKCYEDARRARLNTLPDLLCHYESNWRKDWNAEILITREGLTEDHYFSLGRKLISDYYERFAPFDSDITIGTEMLVNFSLDGGERYKMRGYIDRLSRTADGAHQIHDYKTSAHLPAQQEADSDRQLALYDLGIRQKWPDIGDVRLVWHYLAFDRDLVSARSGDDLSRMVADTKRIIDEIECAVDHPPRESALCAWCEYPDLCPQRKHLVLVEALPVNSFLSEPGVLLVNRYVELRDKEKQIAEEMDLVKEAIVEYACREGVAAIRGSGHVARVKLGEKLKFPGKNDPQREELDSAIMEAGKWMEVSQLDVPALAKAVENKLWDADLIGRVEGFGLVESTSTIHVSKLKQAGQG